MGNLASTDLGKKFRFREFQIYKDVRQFSFDLKKVIRDSFPSYELYALQSQIRRALDSIVLNIAEGADRSTDKDFALFLNRAHTSLNEVVACLDTALDNGYLDSDIHREFLYRAAGLVDQLTAFRNRLLQSPTK